VFRVVLFVIKTARWKWSRGQVMVVVIVKKQIITRTSPAHTTIIT